MEPSPSTPSPSPPAVGPAATSAPASPPSSAKALLWLCLGVALFAVALYFLLGDAWLHWFPRE